MTRSVASHPPGTTPKASSVSPRRASRATSDTKTRAEPSGSSRAILAPGVVDVGDAIRIERRYVVDGQLTSVEDTGRFKGVQLVGSTEHLVLEGGRKRTVRMIPLHSVSEITLKKKGDGRTPRGGADVFDPSFA